MTTPADAVVPPRPRDGLGRGLGALIPKVMPPASPTTPAADPKQTLIEEITASVAALALPAGDPDTRWDPAAVTAAWLRSRRSPHTRRAYFRDLADYLAWLQEAGLDPLRATRPDVDLYLAELRDARPPLSAATLNRKLASISSWYRYLVDADIATRNPAATIDRAPVNRDHSTTIGLTVTEVRALLHAADTEVSRLGPDSPLRPRAERNRLLVAMLASLGLRVSEATGLDLVDLRHNAGHRTVLIRGKGGRDRELPVPAALGRLLDAYLPRQRRLIAGRLLLSKHLSEMEEFDRREWPAPGQPRQFDRAGFSGMTSRHAAETFRLEAMTDGELVARGVNGPLFTTTLYGNRLRQSSVWHLVRRLARVAGLAAADQVSPHSLRHAAATAALDDGAPLRDVQDLLGHADPRTTRRYDRNRGSLDRSPAHRLAVLYAE
ncbi:Phage integrase, N-terminal SAM-like domain [Micromonospora haikouensis]|uniref:Phage integrase, N-terminal SAM-like domain n=1 Tax=Micromonospora haikouensis TaxID=686309 RepID=A0A1C4YR94_9ACTN|nr:tyrosine-type recombinase/integrase [Micromonospora haikouensis]SCF23293.1 Phage integrase, N-terminal SAM-like domain [Micromonospora haikouensis]